MTNTKNITLKESQLNALLTTFRNQEAENKELRKEISMLKSMISETKTTKPKSTKVEVVVKSLPEVAKAIVSRWGYEIVDTTTISDKAIMVNVSNGKKYFVYRNAKGYSRVSQRLPNSVL